MARLPRYFVSGCPQHVIQRGNNRSPLFFADVDYKVFLGMLLNAAQRHACAVHAYVLMTNHVHLLVTPDQPTGLPKTMQSLGRRYVQYVNTTYQRTGTLWEGRYRATLVDSERYLLTCYRYIELNPVRAHMVTQPEDYPWSSYRYHAAGQSDRLVSPHALYTALGQTESERQAHYRALVAEHLDESCLRAIREATNKGWVLGDECFGAAIAAVVARRVRPLAKGRPRRAVRAVNGSLTPIFTRSGFRKPPSLSPCRLPGHCRPASPLSRPARTPSPRPQSVAQQTHHHRGHRKALDRGNR